MSLPNLLIIGAMKAGTSSLHNYLSQHPDIFMSADKELNFFNTSLNWNKGLEWYKSQFDPAFKIRGEASPNYSKWTGTSERIHGILPNAKLIYILREPVTRFVSQCNHNQKDPNLMVEEHKIGKNVEIFTNGLYAKWYQDYLNYFPKEQILLITSEDLRKDRKGVLTNIFDFLEVSPEKFDFEDQQLNVEKHITQDKKLATETVQNLNKNKGFQILKNSMAWLAPLLKPIWNKLFYKKRIIRQLEPKNKAFLMQAYKADLKALKNLSDRQFYYE